MLRYAFLKSDFHPQLLVLGEAGDFLQLSADLGTFAKAPAVMRIIKQQGTAPETDAILTIKPASGRLGLFGPAAGTQVFEWNLDPEWAAHFSTLASELANSDEEAGSELLEIRGDLDEIPVKLSRGEYSDDFLLQTS